MTRNVLLMFAPAQQCPLVEKLCEGAVNVDAKLTAKLLLSICSTESFLRHGLVVVRYALISLTNVIFCFPLPLYE